MNKLLNWLNKLAHKNVVCTIKGHKWQFTDEFACFGKECQRCGEYQLTHNTDELIEAGYLERESYPMPDSIQKEIMRIINKNKSNG